MLLKIFIPLLVFSSFLYPQNKNESMLENSNSTSIQIQETNSKIKELQEQLKKIEDSKASKTDTDILWICIAAALVFFMQAGFALVEAGFTREKNTVNILMKNLVDYTAGTIFFWLIGFSVMFGPQIIKGVGVGELGIADSLLNIAGKPEAAKYAFFLFQLVFAGTAATIVSGAAAERMKFPSYILFSVVMSSLIYPIFGSFVWSGLFDSANKGFLERIGFIDFAGSTTVHSVGGWAALAAAIVLGPRMGKFLPGGSVQPILGHNMTLATLGVFILWVGWFGFNPGSTATIKGGSFAIVAVTTNAAAASGLISAMVVSWILFTKPDISMTLNGALAGLVSVTAGCSNITITSAMLIGAIAGIIVVFSVLLFDKLRIDDPVGAISVHGICGVWGTLAVGLFASESVGGVKGLFNGGGFSLLVVQFIGILTAFVWSFSMNLVLFLTLKFTIGLRVSEEEEIIGLDVLEHGNEAYPTSK